MLAFEKFVSAEMESENSHIVKPHGVRTLCRYGDAFLADSKMAWRSRTLVQTYGVPQVCLHNINRCLRPWHTCFCLSIIFQDSDSSLQLKVVDLIGPLDSKADAELSYTSLKEIVARNEWELFPQLCKTPLQNIC